MSEPMVITAAMVGAETTREQTPYLPITAEEIAEDAVRCREAGAAMVHLHVRTPEGKPSQDAELFRAAIRAIRARTDILIQVSTGGAVGMGVDERCGGLTLTGADRPDMATLTTGTVNFGDEVFWNPRPLVRDIARRIRALGLRPEIECFDVGMVDEARALAKEGLVDLPAHFDFVLGVPGALTAREDALDFMRASLPEGSTWTVAAMGQILLTEWLVLRNWRESDLDEFAEMNADPEVMRFFPALLSREQSREMMQRIQEHFDAHGFGLFAAEEKESGELAGYVGLKAPSFEAPFMPCIEIGWRLRKKFWNRGLATEGARAALAYGFRVLGLEEIVAFAVPANAPSLRVMEKLGMTHYPQEDFDHPRLPAGHPLQRHLLYRVRAAEFMARSGGTGVSHRSEAGRRLEGE